MTRASLGITIVGATLMVGIGVALAVRARTPPAAVDLGTVPPTAVDPAPSTESDRTEASTCNDPRRLRADPHRLVTCLAGLDARIEADRRAMKLLAPVIEKAPERSLTDASLYTLTDGRVVAVSEWIGSGVEQFDLDGDGVYDTACFDDRNRPGPDLVLYDVDGDRQADFARGDVSPYDGKLDPTEVFAFDPSRGTWKGIVPGARSYYSLPQNRFPVAPPAFPFAFFYLG